MINESQLSETAMNLLVMIREDTRGYSKGLSILFTDHEKTQGSYVPYLWTGDNPDILGTGLADLSLIIADAEELKKSGFLQEIKRSTADLRYQLRDARIQ